MKLEDDPNTFTQKDLMQHVLHAAQHSVTREEMAVQFSQAEGVAKDRFNQAELINKERFDLIQERLAQAEAVNKEKINELVADIKEQTRKYDQLVLRAIIVGMLVLFFKDEILNGVV